MTRSMLTHAAERSGARCGVSPRPRAPARAPGRGTARTTGERVANERDALRRFRPALGPQHPSVLRAHAGAIWRSSAEAAGRPRARHRAGGARRGGDADPVGPPRTSAAFPLSRLVSPPTCPFPPSASVARGGEEGSGHAGGRAGARFFLSTSAAVDGSGVCARGRRAGRRASSGMRAGT